MALFQLQCLFGTKCCLRLISVLRLTENTKFLTSQVIVNTHYLYYWQKYHLSAVSDFKNHMPVKLYLPAGSTLVKGMNLVSFHLFLLYLICLNGDMSFPFTHTDLTSHLSWYRPETFLFFPPPAQTNYAWENGEEELVVLHIYFCQRGRQAGSLECQCVCSAASDWCEITVTAAHSGTTNTHTHTDFASGWGSRVQPSTA